VKGHPAAARAVARPHRPRSAPFAPVGLAIEPAFRKTTGRLQAGAEFPGTWRESACCPAVDAARVALVYRLCQGEAARQDAASPTRRRSSICARSWSRLSPEHSDAAISGPSISDCPHRAVGNAAGARPMPAASPRRPGPIARLRLLHRHARPVARSHRKDRWSPGLSGNCWGWAARPLETMRGAPAWGRAGSALRAASSRPAAGPGPEPTIVRSADRRQQHGAPACLRYALCDRSPATQRPLRWGTAAATSAPSCRGRTAPRCLNQGRVSPGDLDCWEEPQPDPVAYQVEDDW